MKPPYPHVAIRPAISAGKLVKLERTGRYEDALALIRHIWPDLSAMPEITDLEPRDAAETLLRCGSLIGFLGHSKQLPNAQERSKNLLTEARTRFLDIYDVEKITECENYLALAYWRTGELNEASAWIDEALSHDLAESNSVHLYCHVTHLLINLEKGLFQANVETGAELEPLFRTHGDSFLCGTFYSNVGIAHQELGNFRKAIECLELARDFYLKARHKIYLGTADNNLAMLYKHAGEFEKAHEAIERSAKVFRQIKERTREGFSFDTKAQIYFAEGRYEEALKSVDQAVGILERSENSSYVVQTYMTKVKTLVFMDNISDAALCLIDAVEIAKKITGEESAKVLTREFESALKERASLVTAASAPAEPAGAKNETLEDGLQLVLPPSISHYTDYEGVWINGTHLEKAGLAKGSLAVVVRQEVRRGDLVAIVEMATDLVSCGFYDADFGVVCLEGMEGSEPQLFDENEIRILGRIVGVCNSGRGPDGKMIVEEVKI
jgi:tetratricopeptide (TPR) repeat protein